jgi:hypothetical protein
MQAGNNTSSSFGNCPTTIISCESTDNFQSKEQTQER